MSNIHRIIEDQVILSSYRATLDEDRAVQLELAIELTKPKNRYHDWHYLIATPFRYQPPFPNARFRPPYTTRNIFYAAYHKETAIYEHSFHFMRERMHLNVAPETGQRSLFSVYANDSQAYHLANHPDCRTLMDRHNYAASQAFIEKNPDINFIIYPSCRDPEQRNNAAVFDIQCLDKEIDSEASIKFFYDYEKKEIVWIDERIRVHWGEVSIR